MEKDKQYIFYGVDFLSTSTLRKKVAETFKESTIAFEHGFKPHTLTRKGVKFQCSYINSNGLHCKTVPKKGEKPMNTVISFDSLTRQQLVCLCNTVNEYYNYCLNEA